MKRLPEVLRKMAVIAVVSSTLIATSATAALAHDELVTNSPKDGSTVAAGLIEVLIQFNEKQLEVGADQGIAIDLIAPDGKSYLVTAPCLNVLGDTIETKFDISLPGDYAVNYRSVSSDGHASSGGYVFHVANANGYETKDGAPVVSTCYGVPIGIGGPATGVATAPPMSGNGDNNLGPLFLGVGLFVIATLAAIFVINRRGKSSKN